jgi:M6 family metalloprotease-like protein
MKKALGLSALIFSLAMQAQASFFKDAPMRFRQPDGTSMILTVTGDEFHRDCESPDGYTLVHDRATGWLSHARIAADGKDYESSGARYQLNFTQPFFRMAGPRFEKHLRLPDAAVRDLVRKHRLSMPQTQGALYAPASGEAYAPAPAPVVVTGIVKSLTILIDFSDDPATIPVANVSAMLNQVGYTGFSNNGSVRDYYHDVSDGNLELTSVVAGYFRADHPKTWYNDPAYSRASVLVNEALNKAVASGFDFNQLTYKANGTLVALNILYAGDPDTTWAKGLWPHMSTVSYLLPNGKRTGAYEMSSLGDILTIGTICHENAHMVMSWPDLYDYNYTSTGVGSWDLMASGSYNGGGRNPAPPNPWLRDKSGWETVTDISSISTATFLSHTANTISSFKVLRPSSQEAFYIESRTKTARSANLPGQGLLVWHVDPAVRTSNNCPSMTASCHYLVSLEQADALQHLEHRVNYGNASDAFYAPLHTAFSDYSAPSARWWDGSVSSVRLCDISAPGDIMTFNYAGDCAYTATPTPSLTPATATPSRTPATFTPSPSFTASPTPFPDGCLEGSLCLISEKGFINPVYAPASPYPAAPPVDGSGFTWMNPDFVASTGWLQAVCQCVNGLAFKMPADILRPPGTYCESVPTPTLPYPYAGGGTDYADWYGPVYLNVPTGSIWWTRRVIDLPPTATVFVATLEYTVDNTSATYFNGNLVHSITDPNDYKYNHVVNLMPYITPGVTRYVFGSKITNESGPSGITYKIKFKYCAWATATPTISLTETPEETETQSNTYTDSPTATFTPSDTSTETQTATFTFSSTSTATPTFTPTSTRTSTPSNTDTITLTFTHSITATITPTSTFTPTPSCTTSPTHTPTLTATPTITPSLTPTPLPLVLHLHPSNPNPFGSQGTYLTFWLSTAARCDVEIWSVSGEKVRDLEPVECKQGGNEIFWDGKNRSGRPVASGVYIYRIVAISPRNERGQGFAKCAAVR